MNKKIVVTSLLALSCVLNIGCGSSSSSNSSSSNSPSQADVANFVGLLASSSATALSSSVSAQNKPTGILKDIPARILKAMPARSLGNLKVKPEDMSVTCNSTGTSCQFYENENIPYSCTTGGTMSLALIMSGIGTSTSASLSIQTIASIIGWTCDGPSITSYPGGVTMNGTFDYPADTFTMTLGGGFTAGNQNCSLNVTVNGNADGSGDISGTACGDSVNSSF